MWDAKSLDITSPVDESENILVYITKKALMGIQFSLDVVYPPFNQVCLYVASYKPLSIRVYVVQCKSCACRENIIHKTFE